MRTPLPDSDAILGSSHTRRRARYLCALPLLQLAVSCSALQPLPGGALTPTSREWLGAARVSLRDGTELVLSEATITPDSIVGLSGATRTRWAVPRSDVAGVDTRDTEPFTTFLAGGFVAVAALFLILRVGSS